MCLSCTINTPPQTHVITYSYCDITITHNTIIKTAYNKYCSHLFDSSFSINCKRFWSLIKALQKDTTGISPSYCDITITHNTIIQTAYNKYCSHLFDSSFSINCKRFWSLIKALRKDTTGISPLKIGNTTQTSSEDKANALNTQFYLV